jgi:hypothetical protein
MACSAASTPGKAGAEAASSNILARWSSICPITASTSASRVVKW